MNAIHRILNRSITAAFYRQHAGLFLFAFFILFGIQPSAFHILQFHYSIILSILDSTSFFSIAFLVWLIYVLKVVLFVRGCFKKEAYDFCYQLRALPPATARRYLATTLLWMLAPLLIYGLLIVIIAITKGRLIAGLGVVIAISFLCLASIQCCWFLLKKGKDNQRIGRRFQWKILRPGLLSMLLQFVFRRQFLALLILKTVSFSALYFFAKTDAGLFEDRMLWLLYITALAGHGAIIYRNFHFMENELAVYRNLPVRYSYTLLSLVAVYAILLIPEIWALKAVLLIQHNGWEYLWLVITGPSLLLLIHCLLYSEDLAMQEFMGLLFGVWVVFIFFSLSDHHWLMPAIGFLFGTIIYRISYYKYEQRFAPPGK